MPQFTYTARAVNGELKSATIEAPNRDEVIKQLRQQRLNVVKIDEGHREEEEARRRDQDARHRHLHASVLDDDQRRSAARAGARHSRDSRARTRRSRT